MGVKTTALAGLTHRFLVISAGETGKSCREFPGARPACRGKPCGQHWVFGSGENQSGYTIDIHGCSVQARTEVIK